MQSDRHISNYHAAYQREGTFRFGAFEAVLCGAPMRPIHPMLRAEVAANSHQESF